jgi:hypothetical protein
VNGDTGRSKVAVALVGKGPLPNDELFEIARVTEPNAL